MTDRPHNPLDLDANDIRDLLAELDKRLRTRGVAASVYVVGGAAMALAYGREHLTPDVDALASHRAVIDEARAIAEERGLSEHWLNESAEPWVPPRPKAALQEPNATGLEVNFAPPEHVLAMKLVALRRKDRPDIRLLIERLEMAHATPEDFADLLEGVYAGEGRLATALGTPLDDEQATRAEALAIGRWAHDFAEPLRREPEDRGD